MSIPIPSPPSVPFLGHVTSIEREVPIRSFRLLAEQYGEIYKLKMINREIIVINSYALLDEVSDEKRFNKKVIGALDQVRNGVGDGLFTAHAPGEQNWYIAHRLLMPAFSPVTTRGMFDDMMDIVSQLVLKWERFGVYHAIDPAEDYTRMTMDAICLCSMSYRLNSFYREGPHPFAKAMADFLIESGLRANRPAFVRAMMSGSNAKYEEDMRVLRSLVDEIIENRKAHPTEKKDVLDTMLYGRDKETGLGLPEENIKFNLLTFLIAGHETTSGMLTFITYYLLKNPECLRRLREEIDSVIGDRQMTANDLNRLPYLLAVMRETLRLSPSAPMRTVSPLEDTTLGGKYAVEKGATVVVNVIVVHRDPRVWGDDANEFRPERMLDGKFEALPPHAWQPFGFGMRGCIGRPFAWQEVQIAVVSILQKFDLTMQDPSYELELKQTLTIKPHNFRIYAIPRSRRPQLPAHPASVVLPPPAEVDKKGEKRPLYVLYGSNTGSSEAFAQRLASDAAAHGFRATIGTLDSAVEHLPSDGPVLIVTASVEGQPTDNAAHFVAWISQLKERELEGVKFGVFGCGNRDWVHTYQRIPKLCDELLGAHGGVRLVARGEADASGGEFFDSFDKWEAETWDILAKEYRIAAAEIGEEAAGVQVQMVAHATARAELLRQPDAALGTVVANRILTSPNAPVKRHLEFKLPENMTFRAGDYLAILPTNPPRDVRRAIAYFGLSPEQEVTLTSAGPTSLPTNKPLSLYTLIGGYVELSQPATPRDLRILSSTASTPAATEALNALSSSYSSEVFAKRLSVLDILESTPGIELSVGAFLGLLPPMRIRQYSISSSPLADPGCASLTISVIAAAAMSGRTEPFLGVASTYLAGLRAGDKVQLTVRPSSAEFHPPADPTIPLVLLGAGSGLAPMRGFLQERAMQKEAGREVAISLLFFGCRAPSEDYLYADSDLKQWKELGVIDVRPAFSRASGESEGCKYVQDRVWHDRADITEAYGQGAKFFVCGSSKVAAGIKAKLTEIIKVNRQVDDAEAAELFGRATKGRFATDVFE
ncbi:cytochrome P450 [Sparassis latifolia]